MTESEAIKVLNMIETHGALSTMAKAKSIEALEKQIPKKPDRWESGHACCCSCKRGIVKEDNYCCYCGQRIDWSDKV